MNDKATLILHCGGEPASYEDVCAVPTPEATDSYYPIAYKPLIDTLAEEVKLRTQLEPYRMRFGLNREGAQLFGLLDYCLTEGDFGGHFELPDTGVDVTKEYGFSIGLRSSHDKSMRPAIIGGTSLFVCDNMSFNGNAFHIFSMHRKNGWDRLVQQIMMQIRGMAQSYGPTVLFQESMKTRELLLTSGYQMLGHMRGTGMLTGTQFNIALGEWKAVFDDRHDTQPFYGEENAFGLYQSVTQALKTGTVTGKMEAYTGASDFFIEMGMADNVWAPKPLADRTITPSQLN